MLFGAGRQAGRQNRHRRSAAPFDTKLSSADEHAGVCNGRARDGSSSCRQGAKAHFTPQHILLEAEVAT